MPLPPEVLEELQVHPGQPANLAKRSTTSTTGDWLGPVGRERPREVAERDLDASKSELVAAQDRLYASDSRAMLVLLQAVDAAGKDGTIKHVMSGVNPQGCAVHAFKQPSAEELRHDFLWRCVKVLPERGHIGIFNRSYYEEVLVVRVHPELLGPQHLVGGRKPGARLWKERFEDINSFEKHLHRSGTEIVKIFLHLSKEEQRQRFLARLDDPDKQWKLSIGDITERERFDDYQAAYEEALTSTSTPWAPWYVVPADHKYAMRALVGGIIVRAIESLDLTRPSVDAALLGQVRAALRGPR